MRPKWLLRLTILAAAAIAAAVLFWPRLPRVAAGALADADRYELLSLAPERSDAPAAGDFHRHRVLGRLVVTDPAVRQRLTDALRAGVAPAYTGRPKCFQPRLGVRLTTGGRTTDLLVCFGCKQALVWQGDAVVADWTTNRTPRPAFDGVLRAAGVPLAADDD